MQSDEQNSGRPRSVIKPLAIGCVVVIAIFAGLAFLGFHLSGELKATEPYKIAIKRIKSDPKVEQLLGGPITDDIAVVSGKINTVSDRGNANLEFNIKGSQRKGRVRLLATLADGAWTIDLLEIVPEKGQTLVLQGGTPEAEK